MKALWPHIVCFLVVYFATLQGVSQNRLDSLKRVLDTTHEGPSKFNAYGNISWYYINTAQLEQAKNYADSIFLLAKKLSDEGGIAYSKFYYGVIARNKGEHQKALEFLNAYVRYNASVGDSIKVSRGLFQIGAVYSTIGDYDKSIKALYRVLKINEEIDDQPNINYALNTIGVVLKEAKRYDESLAMYNKVLETDSLNTDVLMNMGNLYGTKGDLKTAEIYLKKALKIDRANQNNRFVAYDLENLGNLYNQMGEYDKALDYGMQALQIREKLPFPLEEAFSLRQVGISLLKLSKHEEAKKYLLRAEKIAVESKANLPLKDIYKYLAEASSKTNDYKVAFEYQQLYSMVNDSLLNEETARQVNELQTKYETEKKDQQITLLAQEKELQEKETQRQATLKNTFIGGAVVTTLMAVLLFYIFRQRLKNQKELAIKNEEIKEVNFKRQLTELEKKALQLQINPHFIFNCMNSINQLILADEKEKASNYLAKFSKLLRLILENADTDEVPLKSELELISSYVELEKLRFNGEFNCNISFDRAIDAENTYIPSMLIQPFVENSIWHGLRHKTDKNKGSVNITIAKQEEHLLCHIEDDGVGRENAAKLLDKKIYKNKSLGLKITEERLKLISNSLHQKLINITDLKDPSGIALGTRVEVLIPVL